jgi:hypothetical protein
VALFEQSIVRVTPIHLEAIDHLVSLTYVVRKAARVDQDRFPAEDTDVGRVTFQPTDCLLGSLAARRAWNRDFRIAEDVHDAVRLVSLNPVQITIQCLRDS